MHISYVIATGNQHQRSKKPGVKVFIATAHSGAQVDPWVKKRTLLQADGQIVKRTMEVPQPDAVQRYYHAANVIDVHNQYRQGLLALERVWATKSWKTSLFQTYVGIMHVNAFMAYKYEQPSNVTLLDFTEQVAGGLVGAAQQNLVEEGGGVSNSVEANPRLLKTLL